MTQLNIMCSTDEMDFADGQLLDVTGIEEMELTKLECMKKIKIPCSKDLQNLDTIIVRKYSILVRRLTIVFAVMVVIVLERIVTIAT